jgi:hypothetical protein
MWPRTSYEERLGGRWRRRPWMGRKEGEDLSLDLKWRELELCCGRRKGEKEWKQMQQSLQNHFVSEDVFAYQKMSACGDGIGCYAKSLYNL